MTFNRHFNEKLEGMHTDRRAENGASTTLPAPATPPDVITVRGARLHNLRDLTVEVPKYRLVVLTGLSGSGKSTLAFETLHREGQRQYLESLGMVTYQASKPAVESITGLSPSISVDQHLNNRSPRSTVGTVTEVLSYVRLLWARTGHRPCPACGGEVPPSHRVGAGQGPGARSGDEAEGGGSVPCPHCGARVPELVMGHFSFNKPIGACPSCTGLGEVRTADPERLVDGSRSVSEGAVLGWRPQLTARNVPALHAAATHYGFRFDPDTPVARLSERERTLLFHGVDSEEFQRLVDGREAPRTVAAGRFEGVATAVMRRYAERIEDAAYRERTEKLLVARPCPACGGERLNATARSVTVGGRTVIEVQRLSLEELAAWLETLPEVLPAVDLAVAAPVLDDLRERLRRLVDVGVGYLTLGQPSPSLSAGEARRLRLAALLGSGLTGVLYVLDEPTVGLHPSDVRRLVDVLRRLRDLGNTVLVVEHSQEVLRAADHVIDIGPGAGRDGGRVVAEGTPARIAATPGSVTGDQLAGRLPLPATRAREPDRDWALTVRGARAHHLKDLTVRLPLGLLVAVTGASGSGKSTLLFDIVARAARRRFQGSGPAPAAHDGIDGWEWLDRVVQVDQQPISRVPRSNAATYTEVFAPVREAFAATDTARARGFTAGHFSFNVPGGRCERCAGAGLLTMPMQFLPDVPIPCPDCGGRRYGAPVLDVRFAGRTIAEVLDLTVDEALPLFAEVPAVAGRLSRLAEVGLGYLPLGQPATTLSGGEAQRVKLAKELGLRAPGRTLYLLDEPTTGLHAADTARLLGVFQRLVDAGHSVLTVEHDMDVVRACDWVIDLGPGGGAAGGEVVAQGRPRDLARDPASLTGAYL